jgi:hypothetical protein
MPSQKTLDIIKIDSDFNVFFIETQEFSSNTQKLKNSILKIFYFQF